LDRFVLSLRYYRLNRSDLFVRLPRLNLSLQWVLSVLSLLSLRFFLSDRHHRLPRWHLSLLLDRFDL
jgi:hypothetical protein